MLDQIEPKNGDLEQELWTFNRGCRRVLGMGATDGDLKRILWTGDDGDYGRDLWTGN